MDVEILGLKAAALLDPGSTVSIIGSQYKDLVNYNKIPITPDILLLRTVSGMGSTEGVVELNMECPLGNIPFKFVIMSAYSHGVLLGRDFLGSHNILVDVRNGSWRVNDSNSSIRDVDCHNITSLDLDECLSVGLAESLREVTLNGSRENVENMTVLNEHIDSNTDISTEEKVRFKALFHEYSTMFSKRP
ncbi:unnamed protein product, partial [Allacma fusca]